MCFSFTAFSYDEATFRNIANAIRVCPERSRRDDAISFGFLFVLVRYFFKIFRSFICNNSVKILVDIELSNVSSARLI